MSRRLEPRFVLGWVLILGYVLSLYAPPPAQPLITPAPDAAFFERLFPNVPLWWMLGRLLALFVGAILVASVIERPVFLSIPSHDAPYWRRPWVKLVALLAALLHVVSLAYLPLLPLWAQYSFVLWLAVPGALLAWGTGKPAATPTVERRSSITALSIGAVIVLWLVTRLPLSWHSPLAADGVDMWRTFGRLVQIEASGENFLTAPMDPQLPGVTCFELLFHGLPILQIFSQPPTLTFAQVNAAFLMAVAAMEVAVLCALIVGRCAAPVAVAAFLFSPLAFVFQLYPLSAPGWLVVTTLLGLLVLQFFRTGSPAALAFIGAGAGLTASFPTLLPMTAVVVTLTIWRLWRHPRLPMIVMATACLCFVVGFLAGFGIRDLTALREMVSRYYFLHWSWAVGELAMQGQMTPTIHDWTAPAPPPGLVIPIGALLSPFAIARNGLRLWGDVMFEPLSIGLFTVGIAACIRRCWRDRMSLLMLALLAAAMIGAFTSTYDRPSQLRLLGSSIPLALLAAAGFKGTLRGIVSPKARQWLGVALALAIGVSGTVLFEVVNRRILPASALGLSVRAVGDTDLERTVLLTAEGFEPRLDVNPLYRFNQADWLRTDHPYIDEIARTVPKRPIPILTLSAAEADPKYEIYLWSPALEETAEISSRFCEHSPHVPLFTIRDAAGLSSVYAVHRSDPDWRPSSPANQTVAVSCTQGLTRVNHHLRRRHVPRTTAALPPIEQFQYPSADTIGRSGSGEPLWMQLSTHDELAKVIEFYETRFSKPKINISDGAQFVDSGPGGSGLTVTLARRGEGGTLIMIAGPE